MSDPTKPALAAELARIMGVDHAGGSSRDHTAICMVEEDGTVTELETVNPEEIVFLSPEHRQWLRKFWSPTSLEMKLLNEIEKLETQLNHAEEYCRSLHDHER